MTQKRKKMLRKNVKKKILIIPGFEPLCNLPKYRLPVLVRLKFAQPWHLILINPRSPLVAQLIFCKFVTL